MELRFVPTAMQFSMLGQASELDSVPVGMVVGGIQADGPAQALTVLSEVAPPPLATPDATQFVVDAQDTDESDDSDVS